MAEQFDLDAIAADDALLDLLAAGDTSAFGGLGEVEDDPAIHLLAELRLAVEVDEPSFEMVDDAEAFLAACAARSQDPFARRVATRALAAGIAAVAALSISGVAAAVTGDPLSPYEKVFEKVVEELSPRSSFPVRSLDGVVGSKAQGIKASKAIKDQAARTRTGTDENTVEPASDKDLLANRVGPQDRVPPQVPPKPDDKLKPPPLEEERPTEVRPTQPMQTEQPRPPESEPSKPVEPTTQPTTQPTQPPATTTTPTPTPTAATTTTDAPAGGEETNSPQGNGHDNGTSGTQTTTQPPTTAPSVPPGNGEQGNDEQDGDEQGDNKPGHDQTGKPEKPGDDHAGDQDDADHGGQGNDRSQDKPADDPFALIRGILAMLNGVMVTPRG